MDDTELSELFELFSHRLYAHEDRPGVWVLAFDEDGRYYADSDPESDFYIPIPDQYTDRESAEAAIAVLKVWEAPILNEEDCLSGQELVKTPEWAAFAGCLPGSSIAYATEDMYEDRSPGCFWLYQKIILEDVTVRSQ
jgi:hypothetical protein